MSYTYDVKKELSESIDKTRHCKIAELVAITSRCGEYFIKAGASAQLSDNEPHNLGGISLIYQSENILVISAVQRLIKKLYHFNAEVRVISSPSWKSGNIYELAISDSQKRNDDSIDKDNNRDEKQASQILRDMGLLKKSGALFDLSLSHADLIPKNMCCKRAFLKGMFLCCGTISNPKRSYHIEFACRTMDRAKDVQSLLKELGTTANISKRKNRYLVYVKDGDRVSEILGLVGATNSLLDFENTRVLRDIGGNVNRRVNCETANLNKTVKNGMRQVKQIEFIKKKAGLSSLPKDLEEVAKLRLKNPDISLVELGGMLSKPLGKSGINHRFTRIKEIAEELGYKE